MSSGSSLGSLTSTGSQGSQSSVAASLSDIYIDPCHRLAYDVPEIDRAALLQRIERLLQCRDDSPTTSCLQYSHEMPSTAVSQNSVNLSCDAAISSGCLPTYEQHLERQKCRDTPVPMAAAKAGAVDLSDSLQGLVLGPFTSRLIASSSADSWQPLMEMFPTANDVQLNYSLADVSTTQTARYVGQGESDASLGLSGSAAGGSDCAVNRSASRHVSSGSATESDSGVCDTAMQQ